MIGPIAGADPLVVADLPAPSTDPFGECVDCRTSWDPAIGNPGFNGALRDLVVFDDGSGPALYAAGFFTQAGSTVVNRVARWDGSEWSPLVGPNGVGIGGSNEVAALAVFDDGHGPALYAAGNFLTAGGISVNRIAKWDGHEWSALAGPEGVGLNNIAYALAVYDDGGGPALYVGGRFTIAGGIAVGRVARWDGQEWSALFTLGGVGVNDTVHCMVVHDPGNGESLYIGGNFTFAGSVQTQYVARWNGAAWFPLWQSGEWGTNGVVSSLHVHDDGSGEALYAGGSFTAAGGASSANRVAKWKNGIWSALGTGIQGAGSPRVLSLHSFDDGNGSALYAAGLFDTAGGVPAENIAKWDGASWIPLGDPEDAAVSGGSISVVQTYDDGDGPALYIGGGFTSAAGRPANHIARWRVCPPPSDECDWDQIIPGVGGGVVSWVSALQAFEDGNSPSLYAGGLFQQAGGVQASSLARWDGVEWKPVGAGLGGATQPVVYALQLHNSGSDTALYVGGQFATAGGQPATGIARWDASEWASLDDASGLIFHTVYSMASATNSDQPLLYAAGEVTRLGIGNIGVAAWDGETWTPLTGPQGIGPAGHFIRALAILGSDLYAAGEFTTIDGVVVNRIARWDGHAWSALTGPEGMGLDGPAFAMAVFDDGSGPALYVGGSFTTAGSIPAKGVARWDGSHWSALADVCAAGVAGGHVRSLAVHDDGTGPALYLGGSFTHVGGRTVNRIARWDGHRWSPLISPAEFRGTNDWVLALASWGPTLIAGGDFTHAGGVPAGRIAAWNCSYPANPCPADLNDDGSLDFFDLALFVALFQAQDPAADFNNDGLFNFFDFRDYLLAFNAGCP
ncbi:MAG: hypothetical protein LAT64_05840 [Phycisphaerales bacterium]|nr:hypothetical protein [Planctomycetota bacterium]MCH8508277.1 hypothetical protein [Phycisphaerales bacterium]